MLRASGAAPGGTHHRFTLARLTELTGRSRRAQSIGEHLTQRGHVGGCQLRGLGGLTECSELWS